MLLKIAKVIILYFFVLLAAYGCSTNSDNNTEQINALPNSKISGSLKGEWVSGCVKKFSLFVDDYLRDGTHVTTRYVFDGTTKNTLEIYSQYRTDDTCTTIAQPILLDVVKYELGKTINLSDGTEALEINIFQLPNNEPQGYNILTINNDIIYIGNVKAEGAFDGSTINKRPREINYNIPLYKDVGNKT